MSATSVVLHTGGLRFGTEKAVLERVLGRRPGVLAVSANPASQTANVTFAANPAMVGWVLAALLFAGAILTTAPLQLAMHAGVVNVRSAVIAIFIAIVTPLWLEALKHVRPSGKIRESSQARRGCQGTARTARQVIPVGA